MHSAGPDDDARLVEREVGRVEEHDLTDLGVEGIDAERLHDVAAMVCRHRELELDAVDRLQEAQQLVQLFDAEIGRNRHDEPPAGKGQLLTRWKTA